MEDKYKIQKWPREQIEAILSELFFPDVYPKKRVWQENGELRRCIEVSPGIFTGEKGYQEYIESLREKGL